MAEMQNIVNAPLKHGRSCPLRLEGAPGVPTETSVTLTGAVLY